MKDGRLLVHRPLRRPSFECPGGSVPFARSRIRSNRYALAIPILARDPVKLPPSACARCPQPLAFWTALCSQTMPSDASASTQRLSTPLASGFPPSERSPPQPDSLANDTLPLGAQVQRSEQPFHLPHAPLLTGLRAAPRASTACRIGRQLVFHCSRISPRCHDSHQLRLRAKRREISGLKGCRYTRQM